MEIKVTTIGKPDITALSEDTQRLLYETLLNAIEKLYADENTQTEGNKIKFTAYYARINA